MRDKQVTPFVEARLESKLVVLLSKKRWRGRGEKTVIWPQINSRDGLTTRTKTNLEKSKTETNKKQSWRGNSSII